MSRDNSSIVLCTGITPSLDGYSSEMPERCVSMAQVPWYDINAPWAARTAYALGGLLGAPPAQPAVCNTKKEEIPSGCVSYTSCFYFIRRTS